MHLCMLAKLLGGGERLVTVGLGTRERLGAGWGVVEGVVGAQLMGEGERGRAEGTLITVDKREISDRSRKKEHLHIGRNVIGTDLVPSLSASVLVSSEVLACPEPLGAAFL